VPTEVIHNQQAEHKRAIGAGTLGTVQKHRGQRGHGDSFPLARMNPHFSLSPPPEEVSPSLTWDGDR